MPVGVEYVVFGVVHMIVANVATTNAPQTANASPEAGRVGASHSPIGNPKIAASLLWLKVQSPVARATRQPAARPAIGAQSRYLEGAARNIATITNTDTPPTVGVNTLRKIRKNQAISHSVGAAINTQAATKPMPASSMASIVAAKQVSVCP